MDWRVEWEGVKLFVLSGSIVFCCDRGLRHFQACTLAETYSPTYAGSDEVGRYTARSID